MHASGYLHCFLPQQFIPPHLPLPAKSIAKKSTHERLIEAAREEFGMRGIEAATTRAIAKRAGCNEVTLFRHFESKQKLLATVVQSTSEDFQGLCSCRGDFTGNLIEDLTRFATVYTDSFERCEGMARAMIAASHRRPTLAKELIGDVICPFHQSIEHYLDEAKAQGKVKTDTSSRAIAEILTASLMGGVLRRSSNLSEIDRATWIRETVRALTQGILV